jgi:hypothetical protein
MTRVLLEVQRWGVARLTVRERKGLIYLRATAVMASLCCGDVYVTVFYVSWQAAALDEWPCRIGFG